LNDTFDFGSSQQKSNVSRNLFVLFVFAVLLTDPLTTHLITQQTRVFL